MLVSSRAGEEGPSSGSNNCCKHFHGLSWHHSEYCIHTNALHSTISKTLSSYPHPHVNTQKLDASYILCHDHMKSSLSPGSSPGSSALPCSLLERRYRELCNFRDVMELRFGRSPASSWPHFMPYTLSPRHQTTLLLLLLMSVT